MQGIQYDYDLWDIGIVVLRILIILVHACPYVVGENAVFLEHLVILLGVCHVEAKPSVGIGRCIKAPTYGEQVVAASLVGGAINFTERMVMIYSELDRQTGLLYEPTH